MAKIDDGGPAYPVVDVGQDSYGVTRAHAVSIGMSLRDYFAGQALVGMLSNVEAMKLGRPISGESMEGWIALAAYEFADAMLRARAAQSTEAK